MKVWTDKEGKPVEGKEFFHRWGEGMRRITPLQQFQTQLFGTLIILSGVLFGLVVSWINGLWWLVVILTGSLIVTGTQFLGLWQRVMALRNIYKQVQPMKIEELINDGPEK